MWGCLGDCYNNQLEKTNELIITHQRSKIKEEYQNTDEDNIQPIVEKMLGNIKNDNRANVPDKYSNSNRINKEYIINNSKNQIQELNKQIDLKNQEILNLKNKLKKSTNISSDNENKIKSLYKEKNLSNSEILKLNNQIQNIKVNYEKTIKLIISI